MEMKKCRRKRKIWEKFKEMLHSKLKDDYNVVAVAGECMCVGAVGDCVRARMKSIFSLTFPQIKRSMADYAWMFTEIVIQS